MRPASRNAKANATAGEAGAVIEREGIQRGQRYGKREPHGSAEQQPAQAGIARRSDNSPPARWHRSANSDTPKMWTLPFSQEAIRTQAGRAFRMGLRALRIRQPLGPQRLAVGKDCVAGPVYVARKSAPRKISEATANTRLSDGAPGRPRGRVHPVRQAASTGQLYRTMPPLISGTGYAIPDSDEAPIGDCVAVT